MVAPEAGWSNTGAAGTEVSGRLLLVALFHANLRFSAIPAADRPRVLDRSYWPLLDLLERRPELRLALEFPGDTLELLAAEDPTFVGSVARLWGAGRCEVVGSGQVQVVFPLVPARVNVRNLSLGAATYRRLLGRGPRVAYLNEQAYAAGLLALYRRAGYRALVADWDSAPGAVGRPPEERYRPGLALGPAGETFPIVWNSSVAFQKFQRYLAGEIGLDAYLDFLRAHVGAEQRVLCVYGNDWEVIDYHPGELGAPSGSLRVPAEGSAIYRLERLCDAVAADEGLAWSTPSEVLERLRPAGPPLRLESPAEPLPTKKPGKYNVTRWAVCGREAPRLNAECLRLGSLLETIEGVARATRRRAATAPLWRELVLGWASDQRTRTSDDRYLPARHRLAVAVGEARRRLASLLPRVQGRDLAVVNPAPEPFTAEPLVLRLHPPPGALRGRVTLQIGGSEAACQQEDEEHYRDGSLRRLTLVADVQLGPYEVCRAKLGCRQRPPSAKQALAGGSGEPCFQTEAAHLELLPERGAAVRTLVFPSIAPVPLAGTVAHGTLRPIDFSPDWYTGAIVAVGPEGEQLTDLTPAVLLPPPDDPEEFPIRLPVRALARWGLGEVQKTYFVYRRLPRIEIDYELRLRDARPLSMRLGTVTLVPGSFARERLAYRTVNGGFDVETFALAGACVAHHRAVSHRVSASHCLGATEGWVAVDDGERGLAVVRAPGELCPAPLLQYEEAADSFLCRVHWSVAERDDTAAAFWRGRSRVHFVVVGYRGSLEPVRAIGRLQMLRPVVAGQWCEAEPEAGG